MLQVRLNGLSKLGKRFDEEWVAIGTWQPTDTAGWAFWVMERVASFRAVHMLMIFKLSQHEVAL